MRQIPFLGSPPRRLKALLCSAGSLCGPGATAQIFQFSPAADTAQSITLEGYADVYYGYDFSKPPGSDRPYFVNHHRHNEINVNLAYLSARYTAPRARAVFTPGFGTYMNANYAAERVTLRNIVEASVGVKLSRTKAVWFDAGVLSSPYTSETAVSFDQPTLTRSFAPEYVPYYLAGARLSVPLSKRVTAAVYLLNGWQQIEDVNTPLAFGSSVEWKPDSTLTVYTNTFVGNERSAAAPLSRTRYFVDAYALWRPSARWSVTAGVYAGLQSKQDTPSTNYVRKGWGQALVVARYTWNDRSSVSFRAEYFRDPAEVMLKPVTTLLVTNLIGFECFSASAGYNLYATSRVLLRAEARYFRSPDAVFVQEGTTPRHDNVVLTTGIAAKF